MIWFDNNPEICKSALSCRFFGAYISNREQGDFPLSFEKLRDFKKVSVDVPRF
jgi:hypothetical protein